MNNKAIIETKQIGSNVTIMENAIIRKGVKIGNNVIIHPNVVIENGSQICDGCEIFPGTYIGKTPKGSGATTRSISYNKTVIIGENCSIGPNAVIFYDVQVGNNTLIGDGASLREKVKIGSFCIISRYVTINYNTIVGNNTKIMDLTHITGNCNIGNNVFISIHVSTVNDNLVIGREYDADRIKGPSFEDNVTIGAGAIIFPGVIIGMGSMVAAGSIITKHVEKNTLMLGAPARKIKNLN